MCYIPDMDVRIYGSLKNVGRQIAAGTPLPTTVREFLRNAEVPEQSVKLVMINHSPSRPDDVIEAGDRVALFPREYPFFADWKDYWQADR